VLDWVATMPPMVTAMFTATPAAWRATVRSRDHQAGREDGHLLHICHRGVEQPTIGILSSLERDLQRLQLNLGGDQKNTGRLSKVGGSHYAGVVGDNAASGDRGGHSSSCRSRHGWVHSHGTL
jgi:hypothetical protein